MTWLLTWLRPRYMCISIWKLPMTDFISFVHYLSLDIQPSLLNLMLSNKIAENFDLGYPLPRQGFFIGGGGIVLFLIHKVQRNPGLHWRTKINKWFSANVFSALHTYLIVKKARLDSSCIWPNYHYKQLRFGNSLLTFKRI